MSTAVAFPLPDVMPEVFHDAGKIHELIAHVEQVARAHQPDTSTKKGRDAIRSIAANVAKSKTALDTAGKSLNEGLREQIGKVDAVRREVRERLDALKAEVRQPLTDWEEAEERRVSVHKASINEIVQLSVTGGDVASIQAALAAAQGVVVDESFEEFENEAHRAKAAAIAKLEAALAVEQQREAERAELERLRAEAAARAEEDRKRREAEEAEARRIAAEKAEAERQAQIERERREATARAVAEAEARAKAEHERHAREAAEREAALKRQAEEAERRAAAAAQAERDRIAAEQKAAAEAQAKREANARIRKRVIGEIAAALEARLVPSEMARSLAEALADNRIPHCKVTF